MKSPHGAARPPTSGLAVLPPRRRKLMKRCWFVLAFLCALALVMPQPASVQMGMDMFKRSSPCSEPPQLRHPAPAFFVAAGLACPELDQRAPPSQACSSDLQLAQNLCGPPTALPSPFFSGCPLPVSIEAEAAMLLSSSCTFQQTLPVLIGAEGRASSASSALSPLFFPLQQQHNLNRPAAGILLSVRCYLLSLTSPARSSTVHQLHSPNSPS